MGNATYSVSNFLGGELSKFAQGRFDQPQYKVSLNVCLNAFPIEIGAWTRRPGTAFAGATLSGRAGRLIKFDFEQSSPVTIEFTDGAIRFRNGTVLISTNDAATVTAISTANPAVVQLSAPVTWQTGDVGFFSGLGVNNPLLQNRRFTLTKIDTQHFSLTDEISTQTIDGSTLGMFVSGTLNHVHQLVTVYAAGAWSSIRAVQAETTSILLNATLPPQALVVATMPTLSIQAQFSIAAANFTDGPYLDPFTNGAQASPSAVSGIITLQISFATYNAAQAYSAGTFITYSSNNYVSLADQNVGNTPSTSPTYWKETSAGAAINNGQGFLATDIGRQVRLFSEPAPWDATTSYGAGNVVSYNPTGEPGAAVYYSSITNSNTDNVPGTDLTNWQIAPSGVSIWTWGKIIGLTNVIDPALAGSSAFGDMTSGGGLNAVFNGVFQQNAAGSAEKTISGGVTSNLTPLTIQSYVGKNYTGATPQAISQVTIYPSRDQGLVYGFAAPNFTPVPSPIVNTTMTLNLRGSNTPPASASNGTLLGTSGLRANGVAATTILSSDQATHWNYVWIEMIAQGLISVGATEGGAPGYANSWFFTAAIGQISFFSPTGTGISSGVEMEILGPPLLRTVPVSTWRLGAFSNTTGWPTCGAYHEGRLWLGGAIPNRWDASVSNGISGSTINFAPTDQTGTVADSNAISYTLNSDSVNPIQWMMPDLQGVIMGTLASEWLVVAPTSGPITPSNASARRTTNIGSANVEPRRTEHTIIFIKRYARKVMEYFADVFSGKFSAPNIADKAQHIVSAGVVETAYTEATTPVLWGRDADNDLFGATYKRDTLTTSQGPTYAAWHRHALGSGRAVESICAGPSVDGQLDSLAMVTNDLSTNVRHVEVITDTLDELAEMADWWFLDDAVNPSSVVLTQTASAGAPYGGMTVNGLWHLNGKTIQVFAAGLDCGDQGDLKTIVDPVVTNGSCFVPFGDGISAGSGQGQFTYSFASTLPLDQIVVGFTYNSDGQIVRRIEPADTGARSGLALGLKRRTHRYTALMTNTKGISFGEDFNHLNPALLKEADGITPIVTLATFTGVHQDTLDCDSNYDAMLAWRVSRPYQATISAVAGNIETQDQ